MSLMATASEEYINSILHKVASTKMLKNWTHKIGNFENIGQNYFGVIIPVTLTGSDEKGQSYEHQIVLKLAPPDERFRVSGAVTKLFCREIFVYSVLLKKYKEIQNETPFPSPFIIPDVYYVRDEYCKEVIAMGNMLNLGGYKPYTHKPFLDIDHVILALESLARFHALSFLLKEHDSQLYIDVSKICEPLTEKSNKRFMDIMKDRLVKATCKFKNTPYEVLFDKLKLNCERMFDMALELAGVTCICHGDIWKENILFNYGENNEPKQACLIDYQTTRLSSPAFDVLYLIISSTDSSLRQENYHKLLDIYYETFSSSLEFGKRNLKSVYPRELFDCDLKAVAPACLITANTALWLSNGLQEEGHISSKNIWTTPEEKEVAINKYKSVVKGILDDFYSYKYFPGEIM